MTRLIIILAFLLLSISSADAVPIEYTGQGPTGSTFVTGTATSTAATVTLTAASQNITIVNLDATAVLYFTTNGTATSANSSIAAGASYNYIGVPITTFSILSSADSSSYSLFAH